MEAITSLIKQTLASADDAGRRKLLDSLSGLTAQLESEQDIMQKIHYSLLQLPLIRIGCDIKLFELLAKSEAPLTVDQLAQKTGVAPLLMGRILRFLASQRHIAEVDQDLFTANKTTHLLTNEGVVGGVYHNLETTGPCLLALPDFLKGNGYQNIQDFVNTPLQVAHKTDLPGFVWVQTKPENFAHFSRYMSVQYKWLPTWLEVYPISKIVESVRSDPERTLFVDVGGGIGHQSVALRKKLDDDLGRVPNPIIVQDMGMVLEHAKDAKECPGVTLQEIDFWKPQPVKGARIYYLRQILHDYPDDKALMILENLKAALAPDSVILIDDMVISNKGAHQHATQMDMTMMSSLGALERTRDQWYALMERAGLNINHIYQYTATMQQSILECVPVGRKPHV